MKDSMEEKPDQPPTLPDRWIFTWKGGGLGYWIKNGNYAVVTPLIGRPHQVYCPDLFVRKVIGYRKIRPATLNPFLILSPTAYTVVPVLSEPIREYNLAEVKDLVIKTQGKLVMQMGINRKHWEWETLGAQSFDRVFQLLIHPETVLTR